MKQIMTSVVVSIRPEDNIFDALSLMSRENISFVVVLSHNKKPLGVFTDRDAVRILAESKSKDAAIRSVMSSPVLTIHLEEDAYSVVHKLILHHIRHLVVVDETGIAVGVLTLTDVLQHLGLESFPGIKNVSEVMNKKPSLLSEDSIVIDAFKSMIDQESSCVVVISNNKPVGIFTERDALRLGKDNVDLKQTPLVEMMTSPVFTVSDNSTIFEAIAIMEREKIRHLLVLNSKNHFSGLLSQVDIINGIELKYNGFLKTFVLENERELKELNKELEEKVKELKEESRRRSEMEEELKESELWLANIFNSLEEAVLVVAPDRKLMNVNKATEKIFGYSNDELVGYSTEVLHVDHDHYLKFGQMIKVAFDGGEAACCEFEAKRKNGEVFPTEHTVSLLKDDSGNPMGIVSVVRDITERKRSEEALLRGHDELEVKVGERTAELEKSNEDLLLEIEERKRVEGILKESEEQFRLVVEKSPIPMVMTDGEGNIEHFNSKFIDLFGWTTDDVRTPEEWWHAAYPDLEYRKRVQEGWKKAVDKSMVTGTEIEPQEWKLTCKNGELRDVDFRMMPISEERSVISMNDITERKKTEDELRIKDTAINSSINAIALADLEANLFYVNKSLPQMWGYGNEQEVLGKSAFEFWDKPEDAKIVVEALEKKGSYVGKLVARKKDGTNFHVQLSANMVFGSSGKPLAMMGSFVDISESKEAEEKIKASLHEKEILLREVHHRVKNNMQVISSLLRLQAEKMKDEGYANLLMESQERIRSMSLIHEQLYRSPDFVNVDFKAYVNSLVTALFRSHVTDVNKVKMNMILEDVQIDIENAIPCGLIINELVSNCLKHAFPAGREGEITILLRTSGKEDIEFSVSDDGIGLPEELDLKKVETLGLYLVAMLVERQLDGEVKLNREGGTEFQVRFRKLKYEPRI